MKILQINYTDLLGSRFSGRDLNRYFRGLGHQAQQCVWHKNEKSSNTWSLRENAKINHGNNIKRKINKFVSNIEKLLSVQSLLYPWSIQLYYDSRFTDADIVHYHLIHNGFFSLLSMPKLTKLKPSVWSVHDPWLMTGHCVYPYTCDRWKIGCGACPDLNTFMPMRSDNTRYMYRLKKNILARSKIDIIVASKYMLNMVQNSPILSDNRVHYIPFGVDTNIFRPMDSAGLRSKYGISKNSNVISFRETDSEYKGLSYIKEALKRIKLNGHKNPITLLTVNHKGLLTEFEDKYDVVELGMVTDESIMAEFYNCSDIFLMPSTAEAFGMMAIESMACGTPVIVFDGTSLPEVIFAPTGGISVPMKDDGALYSAIKRLLENADERKNIGEQAYRLSRVHYNFEDHARKILSLYVDVIARRKTDNLLA